MPAGRPRTSSPNPEKCIELGKDLVKWATEETKEWRCLFQQWYTQKNILRKEWKTLIQMPEFLPYYEKAQVALAKKALDGTMEKSFGHRYIRLYDKTLVEEENEQKVFESKLRKEEESNKQTTYNIIVPNDLSIGTNVSASSLPDQSNQGSE